MTLQFPKPVTLRNRRYLDWLRTQPCIVTGMYGNEFNAVDPAHIRANGSGGMGVKPADDLALPLLHSEHVRQHQIGEITYWLDTFSVNPGLMMEAVQALARQKYQEWSNNK